MSRRFIITVALSLFALGANARDKTSSEVILSKLHELSSTVMSDFSRVSITSEPALLVMEADAFVRNETAVNAAGRQSGTRRVATAGRQGFVIRLEHRENANSVRRNAETDRGDYIEFSAKIILSQEKPGESTDTRAEAIFLNYQLGKDLPEPWRIRISKLIKELEAFDVKNKEGQGGGRQIVERSMNKPAQFAKRMMQTLQWKKGLCVVLVVLAAIKTIQIFFPQYVSGREEQLFAAIKSEPSVATRCGDFKEISVIKGMGNTTFALENRKNFAAQSYFNVIGEKAAIEVQVNWQEVEGVFSINSIYPVP